MLKLASSLALAAAMSLPVIALAADAPDPSASPTAVATSSARDPRLDALEMLVPEQLAGLPLRSDVQLATGEQLAAEMTEAERALLEAMLTAHGKGLGDYAGINVFVPITETDALVLQGHRVSGIEAPDTLDTWIELLRLNAAEPMVTEADIAGQAVRRFSDPSQPGFPGLTVFAVGDVVWMVVAWDEALVEEAVRALSDTGESGSDDAASG